MFDAGLLLSLPTESIAIRAVVASVVAVLGARLFLWAGLRVPRMRALAATTPSLALIGVTIWCWSSLRLPSLMTAGDAAGAVPIPVGGGYLHFAPVAAPLLVGLWAAIAALRIGARLRSNGRNRRWAEHARATADPLPARVAHALQVVAGQLRVTPPATALVDDCPGGATVVGVRDPILLLDRDLVARLDRDELHGVVAHEIAHVQRRDNLVALVVGGVRDVAFFVPGGRWALRQLHAERELAADRLAADATRRPAALASGLLKVLDRTAPATAGCAALAPHGGIVVRVNTLVSDRSDGPNRSTAEAVVLAGVSALAVVTALQLPALVSDAGQRDVLAVLLRAPQAPPAAAIAATASEALVFQVYRDTSALALEAGSVTASGPAVDDRPDEISPSTLWECSASRAACPDPEVTTGLGLRPRPDVRDDRALVERWRATPLVTADEGPAVYWLARLR